MVRRKIEIKPLEDKAKRHTTFTKRRDGLIKKTIEFCQLSGSSAAMIAFSHSGNCYALGHPHVDAVLGRYEEESPPHGLPTEAETSAVGEHLHGTEEAPPLTEVEKRIADAIKRDCWDEATQGLGAQELEELYAKVENLRREVLAAAAAAKAKAAANEAGSSAGDSCSKLGDN